MTGGARARVVTGCLLVATVGLAPAAPAPGDPVPHYDIAATVRPADGVIEATVEIRFPRRPAGTEHRLLLGRSYAITSLTGVGAEVAASEVDAPIPKMRLITVRPTDTAEASIRVTYAGPLFSLATPAINAVSASLVELSVDSFWLPYSADLGAPFTATALIQGLPAGATMVANVPHRREGAALRLDAAQPTADLAFIAAPGLTESGQGRFRIFAPEPGSPVATYYREHGAASVDFLERMLGPMPGGSATVTVVRRANGSGYARPGYVVVTEVPGAAPTAGQAKFIAHEFSHLWFTRASPTSEDYWLVETPAEYLGLRYVEAALGSAALESLLGPKRAIAAKAPPLLGRGRASDGALYAKGPLLLFDLEATIGRAGVDAVLRELAQAPRHDTALFLTILRRVGGEAAAREFEAKLR
ncbi:MAG: hypothetical protein IT352_03985 [Gemmatimonadales bacterium]|nr:hypothetical protein [Gemmatimonadales bacterium]